MSAGGGAGWRRVGSRSSVTSPAALPTARRVASGQGWVRVEVRVRDRARARNRDRAGARIRARIRVRVGVRVS